MRAERRDVPPPARGDGLRLEPRRQREGEPLRGGPAGDGGSVPPRGVPLLAVSRVVAGRTPLFFFFILCVFFRFVMYYYSLFFCKQAIS